MRKWSDAKLDKELAFAMAAFDAHHVQTSEWLHALMAEIERRKSK